MWPPSWSRSTSGASGIGGSPDAASGEAPGADGPPFDPEAVGPEAFARQATRGVDRQWVRELYSFAVRPDLALYFRVPIDVSVDRLLARRVKLKFYEAGLDMGWSTNAVESFRMFQGKVLDEYDRLVDEYGLSVVNASGSITEQQRTFRKLVSQHLEIENHEQLDESA